jgi:putative oxidoreductase
MNLMTNTGLLLLRLGFSALMIVQHGWKKFTGFESIAPNFPDPLGVGSTFSLALAVAGELLFPVLVVVGFYTRLCTVPVVVTMAVAAFIVHSGDGLGDRESALTYLIGFAVIGLVGPGRFSIDHLRKIQ